MEELSLLMNGFAVAMSPQNVVFMLVGITLGVLIGVLPGLGGANGIAILLPLTFSRARRRRRSPPRSRLLSSARSSP